MSGDNYVNKADENHKSNSDERIIIKEQEMDIVKMIDLEGYSISKCSKKINMSKDTCEEILKDTRKKILTAMTKGLELQIIPDKDEIEESKQYCTFRCATCGYIYKVNYECEKIECPNCMSSKIMSSEEAGFCKKKSFSIKFYKI